MAGNREKRRENGAETVTVEGRNAVTEALRAGLPVETLYLQEGELQEPLREIAALAGQCGVTVKRCARAKLDSLSATGTHQGAVAIARSVENASITDILARAEVAAEKPLVVLCDHIEDPQNLGAIIRNAEVAGAHGVVIPTRRSAQITPAVIRASAGAAFHIPVARVSNLAFAVDELKKSGVWVFGAEAEANTSLYGADLKGPTALAIGSEGAGLSRLIREKCDFTVSIPLRGSINSLNASAAAAVLLFEAVRQRSMQDLF